MTEDLQDELLTVMQGVALDAYVGGVPGSFAADLYRIVFEAADPVIGGTLVTPPIAACLRDLAERSDSWWVRGTGWPARVTLAAARALYRDGVQQSPEDVRVGLLALGESLTGAQRELVLTAAAMVERLVVRAEQRGLRLVK